MGVLTVPVSFGDAADKITILEIKNKRIADPAKRAHVAFELERISPPFFAAIADTAEFRALFAELRAINEKLWQIEDDIRDHERRNDFGPEFIRLARDVYRTNDERARIKRALNVLLKSPIVEEKSYASPGRTANR